MPYGRKARQVRAYEFGCLPPTEGEEAAMEQMRGRVRLWNQLVELTRGYEEKREAALAPYITVPDDEDHRSEYQEQRRAAFKLESTLTVLRALDKQEYEDARLLWLASDLYWVNHEEVKAAWQQAKQKVRTNPGQLRFHAWDRTEGKVSVRWQTGLSVSEAFNGRNTLFRLTSVPDAAYTSPIRSERRRLSRSTVNIRVASANGKPVWLTLPCVLHRPLPVDGLIRSASVIRERVATHYRWKLIIIVASDDVRIPSGQGRVGIDVGWRTVPDGLRVCSWVDGSGNKGDLVLPHTWLSQMQKVDDLQSIRAQRFNAVKETLKAWLSQADSVPETLQKNLRNLSQWRSPNRIAGVILSWRDARFAGDTEIFLQMEAWRQKDKHLYEYQENLRDQLLKSRRERYRHFAAHVASHYGVVTMGDLDLSKIARVKKKGPGATLPLSVRRNRQWAAVYSLRQAIQNACEREGVLFEKTSSANASRRCDACGAVRAFSGAKTREAVCPQCGTIRDQDERAAMNLLSQASAILAQS